MTLEEIGKLMSAISVHYPAFRRHIMDADGKISGGMAREWHRRLGYLELGEALARLDSWLAQPEERRKSAPDTTWFTPQAVRGGRTFERLGEGFDRIDANGHLSNAEGMVFAFPEPDRIYETYHYDGMGRIMDSRGRAAGC